MRRVPLLVLGLASIIAATSCARKQETVQQEATAVDSLLASNPAEQTPGELTPQTQYQEPAPAATTPEPAPAPRKKQRSEQPVASASSAQRLSSVTVPAGTALNVNVAAKISSETAQAGDTWTGSVKDPVIVGDRVVIPAGAAVTGVVSGVRPAAKGTRAALVLALQSVEIDGKSHRLAAGTDSIVAGSTRARNVGAVAGGAAAGALIGKAIGGSNKGALIGGLIGGAAAGGAVAASKGYQVEVREGAELTFTVNEQVVMQ